MVSSALAVLEFDKLREELKEHASSPLGLKRIERLEPFSDPDRVKLEIQKTSEALNLLKEKGGLGLDGLQDVEPILQKLRIRQLVLEPLEILSLVSLAEAGLSIKSLLRGQHLSCPLLYTLSAQMPNLKYIVNEIRGKILPSGEVADDASPELGRIRRSLIRVRQRIHRVLEAYFHLRDADNILQDEFITVRNGRYVIPVKIEQRKAIPGVVHAASSSGATVFIEPFDSIELNNELVSLEELEREEIRRILSVYTDLWRGQLGSLERLAELVSEYDLVFAKAKYSLKHRCCEPEIKSENSISLVQARHPLLERILSKGGQAIVPLTLNLQDPNRVLVISGPNAGGKTVALKTVGLLTLMAHAGMHVPADAASIPFCKQVLADIGDHQSIMESLSTFSSHILNIADMMRKLELPALILLDEIGAGTDPDQGAALGIAVLEHFRSRGAMVVATTHHSMVKAYAFNTSGVDSAAMEFDEASLRPTYRLVMGLSGSSSGLEMASKLGMPDEVIREAKRALGNRDVQAEEHLNRIRERMRQLEEVERNLKDMRAELENERRLLEREYKEKEAKLEAALKAKLDELTAYFLEKSEEILRQIQDRGIRLQLRRIGERQALSLKRRTAERFIADDNSSKREGELEIGDAVRIRSLSLEGTVSRADGSYVEVEVGGKKVKARRDDVQKLEARAESEKGSSLRSSLPPGVILELDKEQVSPELNLLGCSVDEALSRVDKFLDRAFLNNITPVRLIHGHGTGKLRKAIAEFLRTHPHVASFHPGGQGEGGSGVTIVQLKA